jgi:uncharacterized protein YbaR (Trm112 family)
MAIDSQLLEMLVCPDDHSPLQVAEEALISDLNTRIIAGGVVNVGGEAVEKPLVSGLVRQDGALLYPIIDHIPVLLKGEGIVVEAT